MRGYSPAKKRAQPSAASTLHEPYLANTDLLHKNQEGPDLGWQGDGTLKSACQSKQKRVPILNP
jgi:hypothetical protein